MEEEAEEELSDDACCLLVSTEFWMLDFWNGRCWNFGPMGGGGRVRDDYTEVLVGSLARGCW